MRSHLQSEAKLSPQEARLDLAVGMYSSARQDSLRPLIAPVLQQLEEETGFRLGQPKRT